ncbi:hypothetical protein [Streptomyces aureoversilis]|uniref:Uncharacterized protein n=1 Tax=Streptomyces aureoversilis TaxID=67277 RepID=A0ABV9ZT69_9ACTN
MTAPSTGTTARPVISRGGRRRITHVSAGLAEALGPFVRAVTPGEHGAVLAALLLLITVTDSDNSSGHPAPGVRSTALLSPPSAAGRLHALEPGGSLLAALAHEDAPPAGRAS